MPVASPTPFDEILVAVTTTGEVVGALPFETWSYSDSLAWSDPGQGVVAVPLRGDQAVGQADLELLRSIRRFPWTFSAAIVRDQRALWAGPVLTLGRRGGTVTVGAVSLMRLFDSRILITNGYWGDPTNAAANISLTLSTRDLVIELLNQGSTGFRRDLPLDLPAPLGGGGLAITYLAADLGTVSERVKEAVERDDGPDVLITPSLDAEQRWLRWAVEVGDPRIGSMTSVATFDGSITDIEDDVDGTDMTGATYVVGDTTTNDTRLIGCYVTDRGAPHPALERADRTSVSERRPAALASLAASAGAAHKEAAEQVTFTIDADSKPTFGVDYRYGDIVTFEVFNDEWLPDGAYVRRIVSVDQDPDKISLGTVPAEEVAG